LPIELLLVTGRYSSISCLLTIAYCLLNCCWLLVPGRYFSVSCLLPIANCLLSIV